jgi:hypothetical protein
LGIGDREVKSEVGNQKSEKNKHRSEFEIKIRNKEKGSRGIRYLI